MDFLSLDVDGALNVLEDFSNVSLENYFDYKIKLSCVFDTFGKYIDISANACDIIDNIMLVSLLKQEHIKLTDEQNKCNILYKEQINFSISKLRSIKDVIDQIKNEDLYIDSNIIDLLKIDKTFENLKWIILYNKKVNLKKNTISFEETMDVEPVSVAKSDAVSEVKKVQKKKKKRVAKQSDEIVFTNSADVISFVYDKYGIILPSDLNGKDLNLISLIVNLLNQKKCTDIHLEFVDLIFEKFDYKCVYYLSNILSLNVFDVKDVFDLVGVIDGDLVDVLGYINDIGLDTFYQTREDKINILKTGSRNIVKVLRNSFILYVYNLVSISSNTMLSKKINVEYIDQIIETAAFKNLVADANSYFSYYEIPTVQGATPKTLYQKIYKIYFTVISDIDQRKYSKTEFESKLMAMISEKVKKKGLPVQNDINNMFVSLLSKDPILKVESDTSKKSMECIENTIKNFDDGANVYLEYLDSKYIRKNCSIPIYVIPTDKSKVGIDNIFISRNKVLRLINQHILDGDDINAEVVVNCIFYNMIITDDILENAKENIVLELKKVTPAQKIKKSVK